MHLSQVALDVSPPGDQRLPFDARKRGSTQLLINLGQLGLKARLSTAYTFQGAVAVP
ncbi:hypothetical protein ACFSC4_10610 [Deinococcus malanensis]|uniref:hypothetical protein n=1 Tax=Deinococcus malanensis TaxID=1706855 RepID=UPI003634D318